MRAVRVICAWFAAGLCAALLPVAGCGGAGGGGAARFDLVIGGPGYTSGKFHRPRGIAWNPESGMIYVVDWSGRIQKFTTNGYCTASWVMPETDKGKPEDLCVAPGGNVLVADTHYSRIVEFSPDGGFLKSFGSYGTNAGCFIYPVGICCDSTGVIYVSEYGENDRIQKFDRSGRFLAAWGRFGAAPGMFQRPSGLDLSGDGLLYVADGVNHRVQVFDPTGALVRVIGGEGAGPGRFRYPYDVAVSGGMLYVLEFGNQRVQELTPEGRPIAVAGRPGAGDGCFANPWRCAVIAGRLYVSDTDNSRVVRLAADWAGDRGTAE